MKKHVFAIFYLLFAASFSQAQPYWYMPADFPLLITENDISAYIGLEYKRIEALPYGDSYVYHAKFSDQGYIKVTILQHEYSQSDAEYYAEFFGTMIGRLPVIFRERVEMLDLRKRENFRFMYVVVGSGTISILIEEIEAHPAYQEKCTNQPSFYRLSCNSIEETLLHETGHIVQERILSSTSWKEARELDNGLISDYAKKSESEDVAESIVAWAGLRIFPLERLTYLGVGPGRANEAHNGLDYETIQSAIGHRLEVLDDMFRASIVNDPSDFSPIGGILREWVAAIYSTGFAHVDREDIPNHVENSEAFQVRYPRFSFNREFADDFLGDVRGDNISSKLMEVSIGIVTELLDDGMSRGALAILVFNFLLEIADAGEDHEAYEDFGKSATAFANHAVAAQEAYRQSTND